MLGLHILWAGPFYQIVIEEIFKPANNQLPPVCIIVWDQPHPMPHLCQKYNQHQEYTFRNSNSHVQMSESL